jgi:putative membrane protein
LLSSFVKPVLKFLTFPLALLTFGIAWFFVAMFILWLTSAIVSGFHIDGFWTLVGATVVVWAVGAVASRWLFPPKRSNGGNVIDGRFKRG